MADVLALLSAVVIIMAGVLAWFQLRTVRRRQLAIAKRDAVLWASRDISTVDEYIRRIGEVTSMDELNRLENERKEP